MFVLNGKFADATIFTDCIDDTSIIQIKEMLYQPFIEGSKVCIMPDVHVGAGCAIGTTMTLTDKVVPNLVGVDIGCGMAVYRLTEKDIDLGALDMAIYASQITHVKNKIRVDRHPFSRGVEEMLKQLHCFSHINLDKAIHSIGTVGGGNHFIEVDKDEEGNLYLIIHSGSRHLGVEVANYYQNEGFAQIFNKDYSNHIQKMIADLKAAGRQSEIEASIKEYRKNLFINIPKSFAYVSGDLFKNYLEDMEIVQDYATWNRAAIASDILRILNLHVDDYFTTIHNYIDTKRKILRKGAVSAEEGEQLIIPMNMRDGSLLCTGKGNPEWNYSAPHGAGRLYSRAAARANFSVEEYQKEMAGIYTTTVTADTIDECPMAYKPMEAIVSNIKDTVEIEKMIKPIYNFKNAS